MAQACPDRPPAAELEAAIAALPSKKDALREAFDRLAACSPVPLPFVWADLDAYISSLHSSFSLRFRQLQVLETARRTSAASPLGQTLVDGKARNQDEGEEEEVDEVEEEGQEEVREEEAHKAMSKEDNNGDELEVMDAGADGEIQEAGDEMGKKYNKEGEDEEEEPEEVADDEMGNKNEEDEIMEANIVMRKKTSAKKEIDADKEMRMVDEVEQDAKYAKKSLKKAKEEEADEVDQGVNKEDVVAKKVSVMQNKEEAICEDEEEQEAQEADEEEQDASDSKKSFKEAHVEDRDVNKEDVVAKKVSVAQNKHEAACEEEVEEAQEAANDEHDVEDAKKVYRMQDNEEAEKSGSKKVSRELGNRASPGSGKAVCASMNTRWLVRSVCNCIALGKALPIGIHCHPDAPAITLSVVKLFLQNNKPKTNKSWGKCVTFFRSLPAAAAKPSADTMEQAKRVAKDWKEMIENPGSGMVLGNLASWGLLYFLICYNIVSEFDTNEIIRLFGTVPRNKQKNNTVALLSGLGLANRITDLIDYLIENGQQLDAVHLAHVFNLVDKYPPLSLVKGYLEKAKQTVTEIFGKNITSKSQDVVVEKEINNLRDAHNVVKQHISDASQCSIIVAEIVNLLYEYGKKRRSSANGSASTSNSQQQQKQSNGKHKKEELEQGSHVGQEEQQGQLTKTGDKLGQKQNKTQQKQQQGADKQNSNSQQQQKQSTGKRKNEELEQGSHLGQEEQQGQLTKPGDKLGQKQNKPQQKQQQGTHKQENKSQETQQRLSKQPRQRAPKRPKPAVPAVPNMARIGHFGQTRYGAMLGVHGYPAHPCWPGVEGSPFAPPFGAPQYIVPFDDPFYPHPHPPFYPW